MAKQVRNKVKIDKQEEINKIRHSSSHVLAQAVLNLYPNTKLGIGPAIENGFYYDFEFDKNISEDKLLNIEHEMKKIVDEDQKFVRSEKTIGEAIKFLEDQNQPYKVELVKDLESKGETKVSFYQNGPFIDLCSGPHVESTKQIKAFKLLSLAGAYWKGDEKNNQLVRIYGTSFDSQKELDEYLWNLEEAKKRDHKKIGREMELFFFHDSAPGMAYWLPNGLKIKNLLIRYWREYHEKRDYKEVASPLLNKKELWEISGHWQHYKDDMFIVKTKDIWGLKPMNCPNAMIFWKFKPRSWKDLPLRLSDTDLLHRNEIAGSLNGLLRARNFMQDDSHNFVSEDQIKFEVKDILEIVKDFYSVFNILDNVKLYLSTRPDDYMGDLDTWNRAERELHEVLEESGFDYGVKEKDGAFYGPKIDIHLKDSLGREWQCGTIQLDFQLPKKFELEYMDKEGAIKTPVVIHRVIYGSLERFIGIIIEHFAGHFPFWISPLQVSILTLNDKMEDYMKSVKDILDDINLSKPVSNNKLRYEIDNRSERLDKKIKEAEINKIPLIIVIGPKDEDAKEVSVRRSGKQEKVKLEDLKEFIISLNELQE